MEVKELGPTDILVIKTTIPGIVDDDASCAIFSIVWCTIRDLFRVVVALRRELTIHEGPISGHSKRPGRKLDKRPCSLTAKLFTP